MKQWKRRQQPNRRKETGQNQQRKGKDPSQISVRKRRGYARHHNENKDIDRQKM